MRNCLACGGKPEHEMDNVKLKAQLAAAKAEIKEADETLDELRAQNLRFAKEIERLLKLNGDIASENLRLRVALTWYANKNNWDDDGRAGRGDGDPEDGDWILDNGRRAQSALNGGKP